MIYSNKKIGECIAKARTANNESQQTLADALGVKREIVTYWENGTRPIKADMLLEIAKRYHVTGGFLLGLENIPDATANARLAAEYTGLSLSSIEKIRAIDDKPLIDALFNCDYFSSDFIPALADTLMHIIMSDGIEEDPKSYNHPLVMEDFYNDLRLSKFEASEALSELFSRLGYDIAVAKYENRMKALYELYKSNPLQSGATGGADDGE